jgi:hypothetical protein
MKRYSICFTSEAEINVSTLYNWIKYELHQPFTSDKYIADLKETILQLRVYADAIAFSPYDYIQSRYGPKARHITYKKMTIIYTITDDTVLIKRVMPSKLIR